MNVILIDMFSCWTSKSLVYFDLNTSIDYMKRLTQTQASLPAEPPFALDNDYKNNAKIFKYKRYINT